MGFVAAIAARRPLAPKRPSLAARLRHSAPPCTIRALPAAGRQLSRAEQRAAAPTHEGGEVRRLGGVIPGEGLHLALAALAALLGQEAQVAVARGLELQGGREERRVRWRWASCTPRHAWRAAGTSSSPMTPCPGCCRCMTPGMLHAAPAASPRRHAPSLYLAVGHPGEGASKRARKGPRQAPPGALGRRHFPGPSSGPAEPRALPIAIQPSRCVPSPPSQPPSPADSGRSSSGSQGSCAGQNPLTAGPQRGRVGSVRVGRHPIAAASVGAG